MSLKEIIFFKTQNIKMPCQSVNDYTFSLQTMCINLSPSNIQSAIMAIGSFFAISYRVHRHFLRWFLKWNPTNQREKVKWYCPQVSLTSTTFLTQQHKWCIFKDYLDAYRSSLKDPLHDLTKVNSIRLETEPP